MISATDSSAVAVEGQGQGEYGCTLDELKALVSLRGREAYHKIQDDYRPGGVLEICRRLQTSPLHGSRAAQHLSLSRSLCYLFPCLSARLGRRIGWGRNRRPGGALAMWNL